MTQNPPAEDAAAIINKLKAKYPRASFIALGQTVFWDEPVKAAWRRLLDRHYPDAQMIAGVHDTDYFAKSTSLVHDDQPFLSLAHNDGATRGLWSAAGELSALFGSEDLPTRAEYEKFGVPFNELASDYPPGKSRFYTDKTEAWGWRGIVATRSSAIIARDVKVSDYLPALLSQLDWGFESSIANLVPEMREPAKEIAARIRKWVAEHAGQSSKCTLSSLYEALLPKFYSLLLGEKLSNFSTTTSTKLFQFNSRTCQLPRFNIVGLFVNPETSEICKDAYNRAVAGGGMYGLDSFGEGAIPFDLVIPGIGRGTLHVKDGQASVDLTGGNLQFSTDRIADLQGLAEAVEARFGTDVALVGKAVALIDMIAAEFLIVFHETASGYTDRTTAMNDEIRDRGIMLNLYPITRLSYATWDSLSAAPESTKFQLPAHMSDAFGRATISATNFAARWRGVVASQRETLKVLAELRSPRDIMNYLEQSGDLKQCWSCHLELYDNALRNLAMLAEQNDTTKQRIAQLRGQRFEARKSITRLQDRKGAHFRKHVLPLIEQINRMESADNLVESVPLQVLVAKRQFLRRSTFDRRIENMLKTVRQIGREIKEARAVLRAAERSPKALEERELIRKCRIDAEFAKLEHVRTAIIATSSLPHTNSRPTAWWLPMVDPSGAWFSAIVDSTKARLERL